MYFCDNYYVQKTSRLKNLRHNFWGPIQFAFGWFSENRMLPTWSIFKSSKILHRVFLWCFKNEKKVFIWKLKVNLFYYHTNIGIYTKLYKLQKWFNIKLINNQKVFRRCHNAGIPNKFTNGKKVFNQSVSISWQSAK